MAKSNSGHVAMVELIVVILFFSISSVVILRLFASTYQMGQDSARLTQATEEMQTIAEKLYAFGCNDAFFEENGWTKTNAGYEKSTGVITYRAENVHNEQVNQFTLRAVADEKTLIEWPVARYIGEGNAL